MTGHARVTIVGPNRWIPFRWWWYVRIETGSRYETETADGYALTEARAQRKATRAAARLARKLNRDGAVRRREYSIPVDIEDTP